MILRASPPAMYRMHPTPELLSPQQGTAICAGGGFVVLELTGTVHISQLEKGNVYIHCARHVWAQGQGQRLDRGEWTFLYGWEGPVHLEGCCFQVQVASKAFELTATGRGYARLRGEGACTINGVSYPLTSEFQEFTLQQNLPRA